MVGIDSGVRVCLVRGLVVRAARQLHALVHGRAVLPGSRGKPLHGQGENHQP
jgi:hypothetical protein